MKPTQELMKEHQDILAMLEVLKKVSDRLDAGEALDAAHLEKAVEFIRGFADACHHGKEEVHLFRAMEDAGIPNQGGPLGVMFHEHKLGRDHVRAMADSIAGIKAGDAAARRRFAENARGYAALLARHIHKEDHVLYPMADARLTEDQQAALAARFAEVEKTVAGAGGHERYHALLRELEKAYLG